MGSDKLDVIRKLLAKADGAATVPEAESYTAKAMELMARHGIDAAVLGAVHPGSDKIDATGVEISDPYSAGKARLLAWMASALRCRAVLHEAWGGKVAAVTVFGFASDRERVELLYTSLLLQATGQLARQRPPFRGESVAAYRRSWLHGFAVEVQRRLVAAEELAEHEATRHVPPGQATVGLVLAERATRVESAFAAAYPRLGTSRRSMLSGSGYAAGAAAGGRADLGGPAVVPMRRRAIGA